MKAEILQTVSNLNLERKPYCLVTLINIRGSAPQEIGAKVIVTSEGLYGGTIGGGKLEAAAIKYAAEKLYPNNVVPALKCELVCWNLQKEIGMSCGGEVELLFEFENTKTWNIAVFGAGHVSQSLTRVLITLDCSLQVFDTREEWISKLPKDFKLKTRQVNNLAEQVESLPIGSAVVVMTQGHATDVPVLKAAFDWGKYSYIGVLGSEVKALKIKNELRNAGITAEVLEKLHCPMGLDIGESVPQEMAISISAQLLKYRK